MQHNRQNSVISVFFSSYALKIFVLHRFPKDVRTYGIDKQFLWGKSLLVTPVLDPGVDYVNGYFPEGLWYDYYTVRPTLSVQTHFTAYYS